MNLLEKIIHQNIVQHGPMDVGQFMALALGHPEHGYYMKQDPFGRSGDFVTAPEVSQMFGEVLGAWAAHSWMQMGAPSEFVLLECGPGRGTLMADMLRAIRRVDGFLKAAQIHLLEISPALKARQANLLNEHAPEWHDTLGDVPNDLPIIIIGNEFLDALPFRQLAYQAGAWHERVIDYQDVLVFGSRAVPKAVWPNFGKPQDDDIFEFSPARENFVSAMCERIKESSGAALLIDYGHGKSAFGDTFQAIRGHEYVDPLNDAGNVDLTAHVDFESLVNIANEAGCSVQPIIEQGEFLKMLGVEARAAYLMDKGARNVEKDLHRLTDRDEMGALFKVMDFRYGF